MNYISVENSENSNGDSNIFIPIKNRNNNTCYHVALLQLFHTSKTFNKLIQTLKFMNDSNDEDTYVYKLMLQPFYVYSKINESNIDETYLNISKAYDEMFRIIHENCRNGYSSHIVEYFYILPILNELFPRDVEKIMNEINVDPIHLNIPELKIRYVIKNSPFVVEKYQDLFIDLTRKLVSRFINGEFRITNHELVGAIVEIFPNINSVDGGHAVFILKNIDKYFIFDDDTTLDMFENYVKNRNNNIHKIYIYSNDTNSIHEIQKLWGRDILTRRVNNRYEFINNSQNKSEEINEISKSFISIHQNSNFNTIQMNKDSVNEIEKPSSPIEITGGESTPKSFKIPFIIFLVSTIILVIILVIESILVIRNRFTEKYKCPCRKSKK